MPATQPESVVAVGDATRLLQPLCVLEAVVAATRAGPTDVTEPARGWPRRRR